MQVGKEQSRDLRLKNGADASEAPRNASQVHVHDRLSDKQKNDLEEAAHIRIAASQARSDNSRTLDDQEGMFGGASAPPSQSAAADLSNQPTKPAILVRTAARDDSTKSETVGPKAAITKHDVANNDKDAAGARKDEPAKPANAPQKKLAGTVAAPSVG